MFLLILEDGQIKKMNDASEADKQAADEGMCDIVDISRPDPLCYYNGKWNEIEIA